MINGDLLTIKEQIIALNNADTGLSKLIDKGMLARWDAFLRQHEAYDELQTDDPKLAKYKQLRDWPNRPEFKKRIAKLNRIFAGLHELQAVPLSQNKKALEALLLLKVNIILTEFEAAQLEFLQKIQHIKRDEINDLKNYIKSARKKYDNDLWVVDYIEPGNLTPELNAFLHHEKRKFHLTSKVKAANRAGMAFGFASRGLHMLTLLVNGIQILGAALTVIPLVSAIVTAISSILSAARTWFKNKSRTKKALSIVLGVIAVAVLVNVGLGTVATGGLVAGLIAVGVIKNQVLPWFRVRRMIAEKQAIIDQILDRQKPTRGKRFKPIQALTTFEKNLLLNALEKKFLHAKESEKVVIKNAMQLVAAGDVGAIKSDNVIRDIIGKHKTLEKYIVENSKAHLANLQTAVANLSKKRNMKFAGMLNGFIGIAGAILMCIPTPPTLIAGASLLLLNSAVGLALHFGLPEKIMNLFAKLKKSEQSIPTHESRRKYSTESMMNKMRHTKQDIPMPAEPQVSASKQPIRTQRIPKYANGAYGMMKPPRSHHRKPNGDTNPPLGVKMSRSRVE